jgi:hypothetical protein
MDGLKAALRTLALSIYSQIKSAYPNLFSGRSGPASPILRDRSGVRPFSGLVNLWTATGFSAETKDISAMPGPGTSSFGDCSK